MTNSLLQQSVAGFTLFGFLLVGNAAPASALVAPTETVPDTVYADVKRQMENVKNGLPPEEPGWFSWNEPRPILAVEQNGGFLSLGSDFDEFGLDVLTGKDSIYESMQLGDFTNAHEVDLQLLENLKSAIGVFREVTGSYPESLADFAEFEGERWASIQFHQERKNISAMSKILEYRPVREKTGERSFICAGVYKHLSWENLDAAPQGYVEKVRNEDPEMCETQAKVLAGEDCCLYVDTEITSFSVSLRHLEASEIPLADVKTIETKSHEFAELIEAEGVSAEVPEIASIVPADAFVIHFASVEKYGELAAALSNPLAEAGQFLPIPTPEKFEQMVAKRLGIPDPTAFLSLVEEFAFVGEDIRVFPKADYAMIVKWKNQGTSLLAKMLETGENKFGQVGDYFVFATSEKLFNDIMAVENGTSPRKPLSSEQDYYYSLGVTEQNRDGFVFFSDAFIRKMVSPEYRIALRRQQTVLSAMNTLQYVVWAYKDLEGDLPKSFQEIADKGYIRDEGIYRVEDYSIDSEGIVHHNAWGTPFDVTPVTRVPVETVSEREKVWYEEQRDMYQSSYRRFFDPVGVSVTVADKILFHTVILPLAETREYEMFRAIVGSKQKEVFTLLQGDKSVLQGAIAFDFDSLIYQLSDVYDSAQMKATDSIRQSELFMIRSAVEQYFGDNGRYPGDLDELVTGYYMQRIPNDPSGDEYGYQLYNSSSVGKGQCYRIFARLSEFNTLRMENDNGIDPDLLEMSNCLLDSFDIEPIGLGPRTQESEEDSLSEEERKQAAIDRFEAQVRSFLSSYTKAQSTILANDSIIQNDILSLRSGVEQYFGDNAMYPDALDRIVEEKYVHDIPLDPYGNTYRYDVFDNPESGNKNECYRLAAYLYAEGNQTKMNSEMDGGADPNLWEIGVCHNDWKTLPLADPPPKPAPDPESESEDDEMFSGRIFDFLGDEIAIGIGEETIFDLSKIGEIDAYLAILLTDREKAEGFFNLVVEAFTSGSGGFFRIKEPVTKEWNGVQYYAVPDGFMNLYALFEDDRVYFTLSEKAIHSRIEGKDEVADDRFFRLNAFLTGTKAAILRADFAKAEQWLEAMPQDLGQEMAQAYFAGYVEKPYAMEYFSLEQVLGEDFMKEHFMHRPQILGYTPVWQDGKLQWEKDGVIFDQDDNEQLLAHGAELLESAKAIYTAYGKGGLSFAFTPHGAEIRIAFNNPGQEEEDGRFVSMSAEAGVAAMRNKMEETEAISDSDSENPGDTDFKSLLKENQTVLLLGGVAVLVLVVFVVFGRRK